MTNRLELRVVVPAPPRSRGPVQVRPVIDGRDILNEFPAGPGHEPETMLATLGPLTARAQPREVSLATADCTEGCCGALYVTVRRDGDSVVWGEWRDPEDDDIELPEFRFDAAEYDRELRRAAADTSWEWFARTVARLLGRRLRETPEVLARWDCELQAVVAWPWQRGIVTVLLYHPHRSSATQNTPWRQLLLHLPVEPGDPEGEAKRLADRIAVMDPRHAGSPSGDD
ncbi:hypothetical protein [Actinoplanes xinjiangensis]|uniref:hypothetical protein n=1 Tax=Actinoplanes xinjiangensis TaxID=512350 RepID=UPI0011B571A7|nr:hypothetical protein [Actinoplanes xinjiangensis]